MKTIFYLCLSSCLYAQGTLTPPSAPAPTQKSLQQIWDKIGALETHNAELQTQVNELRVQNLMTLYANQENIPWITSTIAGNNYKAPSIRLAPDGHPAVAYLDYNNYDLKYARYNGSTWNITTVDSAGIVGLNPSLAFDANNNAAIAYYGATNGELKWARLNGSTWTISTVDNTGDVGQNPSLAFNKNGVAAISYYDETNKNIKAARYNGTSWNITPLDQTINPSYWYCNKYSSLAIASNGHPGIAYQVGGNLKFAEYNGSSWDLSVVTQNNHEYGNCSLAFLPNGNSVISYGNTTTGEIMLAQRHFGSMSWYISKVANTSGESISNFDPLQYDPLNEIAIGFDGQPAVICFSKGNYSLNLARMKNGAWITQYIDSGRPFSMCFDSMGLPMICCESNGDIDITRQGLLTP